MKRVALILAACLIATASPPASQPAGATVIDAPLPLLAARLDALEGIMSEWLQGAPRV